MRHLLLHARQRPRRRRDARLHGAARLRPPDGHRPAGRAEGHAAVDRMEAHRLQEEGSAEVVRRRDDLARHRPGLQRVHDAAAGAGRGDCRRRRPALHAAPGARGRELRHPRRARARLPGPAQARVEAGARRLHPQRALRRDPGRHLGALVRERAVQVGRQDRDRPGDRDQGEREVQRRQDRRAPSRPCPLCRVRAARGAARRARHGGRERRLRRRRGSADRAPHLRLPARRPVPERGRHRRDPARPVDRAGRPAAADRVGAAAGRDRRRRGDGARRSRGCAAASAPPPAPPERPATREQVALRPETP